MSNPIREPPSTAHEKIRTLHLYWARAGQRRGALPGRRNIDPVDLPQLLPHLWLMDAVGAPPRFRVRLIGEAPRRLGIPAKPGDFLDEMPQRTTEPLEDLARVVAERRPSWYRGPAALRHASEMFELERLFHPLATVGRKVETLHAITVFYTLQGREI
jgi:hypothetical protein